MDSLQVCDCGGPGEQAGRRTPESSAEQEDVSQCAICLETVKSYDMAVVKPCEHTYCVCCILQWVAAQPRRKCPTCKCDFSTLYVHKTIDGRILEVPTELPVALLVRAPWFKEWQVVHKKLGALNISDDAEELPTDAALAMRSSVAVAQEEAAEEAMYGYFEDEYDDDDLEDLYLQGSSGSRLAIGNRRWGPNGYVSSGRRQATPVQPRSSTKNGKGSGKSSRAPAGSSESAASRTSTGGGARESAKPGGRRARRAAKRAVADAAQDYY